MSNLKCEAVRCAYNTDRFCSANEIEVQGGNTLRGRSTYCGTFDERDQVGGMKEMSQLSQSDLSDLAGTGLDPVVACNAENCRYNHDRYCQAEGINITSAVASTAEQTECQTFAPR
ncbi:Domain of unknown function DUF1540 [Acididesulfobacillus acetoxydans]|uniref:DUF1540 domain-containing protein n=1 Tax=Acididesulfobacillus acetoxydans TaxID=1561005 RepID=A0A8S0XX26_9FIRM|nr:DUF1540 domain-containing protein [Acididesulfobacillus acetoxydans]CAA7601427.1 Domain of unknown function DUF1540 [Acididesulfobacillus acetoxydans]CEJ08858.1 Domain of Unknown Function (DUF1540) [Acididesulfobacillus acetoxydans]